MYLLVILANRRRKCLGQGCPHFKGRGQKCAWFGQTVHSLHIELGEAECDLGRLLRAQPPEPVISVMVEEENN